MLKITSINVNGIRSAVKKGFFEWLAKEKSDIVCLQEIKISHEDLSHELRHPLDYQGEFHHAVKKGYSGVGLYSRLPVSHYRIGMDSEEFDAEGRLLCANFGTFSVVSAYLPSGSSSPERQEAKFRFLDLFGPYLDHMMAHYRETGHDYIICGDWNMAHREIDLKNWRGNLKNSGFTPKERAWMTDLFEKRGFVDVFRLLNQEADQYTWWSNRGQAWAKNVGWRIDYQIATPTIASKARRVAIYKDERFSDHAPLTIEYEV